MPTLSQRYPGGALITGASAGLGEAFARRCASEGMDVALVARRRDRLDALASAIEQEHKVRAVSIPVDLSAHDAAEQVQAQVEAAGMAISMLINNAGFGSHARYHETSPAWHLQMVDVNCRAPVALTNVFLPPMIARFLASTAAYQATPYFAVYGASKSFNLMLGEALWAEMKPLGVDCLAVSPGYTVTEFQEVASIRTLPPKSLWRQPDQVVRTCFNALGKQPSVVDGLGNAASAMASQLAPRRAAVQIAGAVLKPQGGTLRK
jgi:short-subunit dehydrogenase